MVQLIISALAVSETYDTPQSAYITISVSDAETGEPVFEISSTDIEIWDTSQKAHIRHFHSYKSGLYTMFADWSERTITGNLKVYGLFIKVRKSRSVAFAENRNEIIWDFGQVIVPLQLVPG